MGNSLNAALERSGVSDGKPGGWVDLPNKCTEAKDIDDYFEVIRSYGTVPGEKPSEGEEQSSSWFISKAERQAIVSAKESRTAASTEATRSSERPESDERERDETKRPLSSKASSKQVHPVTASPPSPSSAAPLDATTHAVVKLKPTRG